MAYIISRFCRICPDLASSDSVLIKTNSFQEIQSGEFAELYKGASLDYPKYFKMDAVSKYGILATEYLLMGIDLKANYSETEI